MHGWGDAFGGDAKHGPLRGKARHERQEFSLRLVADLVNTARTTRRRAKRAIGVSDRGDAENRKGSELLRLIAVALFWNALAFQGTDAGLFRNYGQIPRE